MRFATLAAPALMLLAACAAAPDLSASDGKVSRPNEYSGWSEKSYDGHQRSSFYVQARDGTKLAVDLFRPTKGGVVASEKLPVVWMHTPYNRRAYRGGEAAETYPGFALKLAPYGYNVAVVDFRGVYASYGKNIAYNRGEWVDGAKWDAYDVTEWFAKQPWSNGRIGMWGCSATGGSQMQALTTRPPSLKAVVPMSAEFDAYHFTTMGGVSGPGRIAPPGQSGENSAVAGRDRLAAPVDGPEAQAQLAAAVASHKDNIESVGVVPFKDSVSQSTGLVWWEKSSPHAYLDELKKSDIGVLSVANWDEAGTRHGPFFTFNNLPRENTKLLVGPATHCAWTAVKDETGFDLVTEELRFFDYWLKGKQNNVMREPAVTYFTYNAPKESQWRSSETWPLKNERRTEFYLSGGSVLDRNKPAAAAERSTPMGAAPVAQTVTIEAAPGGAVFETPALVEDMEVTGHPAMTLWVKTDAGDTDVTARIDDVAPDGSTRSYQMLGRLRASHRQLATPPYNHLGLPWQTHRIADARPAPAGQPIELKFDLLPMSYIFKSGHKVRLTLTFADPQRRESPPPVTVLSGGATPSALTLPLIPAR
ncbi:MAG TPA: CocE/NonD family hydrolase [Hyphomonadaceae bacterium]